MELVPSFDGAFEVFTGVPPDGVALEADVALEAELTEHLKKGLLVVVSTIEGLDELPPAGPPFLGPAGADLPEQGLGIGEGGFEVGLWLDLQEMAKVEHDPDVVPFAFAGYTHGGAQGVDVEASVRIENDTQAGLLGLVGNFPDEGHRLLVGVVFFAAQDVELENGIPSLEILDGLAYILAVGVFLGAKASADVEAEEFQSGLVVELEALRQGQFALGELGRSDPVVAQFLEDLDAFRSGLEVDPVLEGEDGPDLGFGGKLSDEEKKGKDGNCISHGWIGF